MNETFVKEQKEFINKNCIFCTGYLKCIKKNKFNYNSEINMRTYRYCSEYYDFSKRTLVKILLEELPLRFTIPEIKKIMNKLSLHAIPIHRNRHSLKDTSNMILNLQFRLFLRKDLGIEKTGEKIKNADVYKRKDTY